jgi:uncharacterized protein (TIGR03437 family)
MDDYANAVETPGPGDTPNSGSLDATPNRWSQRLQPTDVAAARSFIAGEGPWFIVTGDFNGDGKADTAVANFTSNNVSFLLGNGNGTLQTAVNYPVGVEPNWMAVGDLNKDGKLDLVVATFGCAPCTSGQLPGGTWVLLGNGDGTFQTPVRASPGTVTTVAIGDFNGDGKPDLLEAGVGSIEVNLLLGNGDGSFQAPKTFITAGIGGSVAVAGDFNGDGKLDTLVPDSSTGNLAVLLGKGDGTFGDAIISGTQELGSNGFIFAAAGDFNGDHKLDVVTLNSLSNYMQVWLGNGDGTFQPSTTYTVGPDPTSLVIGDFNRDGTLDLAAISGPLPSTISIFLGKGNGTFQPEVNYIPTGNAIKSLAMADFNGDGNIDLAISSQVLNRQTGVYVVLGNGDGTLQTPPTYKTGKNPQTAAIGDLNGDGIPDLAVASNGSNTVSVLLGKGNGTFQPAVDYPAGQGATGVAIADFNGDGNPDIVTANVAVGSVSLLLGNGDGTFQSQKKTSIMFGAIALATGDFNKDGKQDVVVLGIIGVTILLGNGDGTFQDGVNYGTRSGLGNVVVADFNGDGNADLAVSNTSSNAISILLGNGNGTFQTNVDFTADTKSSVQTLAVGDLNGDGKLDIAVANFGCNPCDQPNPLGSVSVLMGNGNGTFQSFVTYPAGDPAQSIAIADFNGDGKPDIAYTNFLSYRVSILQNNGDGTFPAPAGFGADNGPLFVTTGDLNRDGKPDLVAVNGGMSDVSILLNNCSCSGGSCVTVTAIINGASFARGISPGQWVTIEGTNLFNGAPKALGFVNGSYPTSSDGLSVTIGGQPAFLEFLSPTQLNVISPDLSGSGPVDVVVTNNGAASDPVQAQLQAVAPAFFLWPGGYAVATDINFKLKIKAGTFQGVSTTPPAPGDVLVLWGTGFGPASPGVQAGHQVPGSPTSNISGSVQVKIGDQDAKIFGAALAPGFAALVQVAVEVPNLADGDYPVVVSEGGISSPSTTLLTIKK